MGESRDIIRVQSLLITLLFLGLFVTYAVNMNEINKLKAEYEEENQLLRYSISELRSDIESLRDKIDEVDDYYQEQLDVFNMQLDELEGIVNQQGVEIDDINDYLFTDTAENLIPVEWIASTETIPVDLTGFMKMDADDSISANSSTIIWTEMDRSLERRVYTELSEAQKQAHIVEFTFELNKFVNPDSVNRRTVTFWMLARTIEIGPTGERSFIQLYAEEVGDSSSRFKLIMHQRVDGPNTFVDDGPVLDVNQTYKARIFYYNNSIMYEIWSGAEFEDLIYTMDEVASTPQDYPYLMFTTMFVNNNDQTIWSSGKISNVSISD